MSISRSLLSIVTRRAHKSLLRSMLKAMSSASIRIRLLAFGSLKTIVSPDGDWRELTPNASVADLLATLSREGRIDAAALNSSAIAVNQHYTARTHTLQDGDEVAILPPVSGGLAPSPRRPRSSRWSASPSTPPPSSAPSRPEPTEPSASSTASSATTPAAAAPCTSTTKPTRRWPCSRCTSCAPRPSSTSRCARSPSSIGLGAW